MRTLRNSAGYTARCEVYKSVGGKRVKGTFMAYGHKRPFNVKLKKDGSFSIGFSGSGSTRFVWGE